MILTIIAPILKNKKNISPETQIQTFQQHMHHMFQTRSNFMIKANKHSMIEFLLKISIINNPMLLRGFRK